MTGRAVMAACMLLLAFAGCKKEENVQTAHSVSKSGCLDDDAPLGVCRPFRSVTGYHATCKDLTRVSNCMEMICLGSDSLGTFTSGNLADSSFVEFVVGSDQIVTTAEQDEILDAGIAWVEDNVPAGATIWHIDFSAHPFSVSGGVRFAHIRVTAAYAACP